MERGGVLGGETSKTVQEPGDHFPGHPGLARVHQPHGLGKEGVELVVLEIAQGAAGERIQDSGLGGAAGEQNHFGPRALLTADPELGDPGLWPNATPRAGYGV